MPASFGDPHDQELPGETISKFGENLSSFALSCFYDIICKRPIRNVKILDGIPLLNYFMFFSPKVQAFLLQIRGCYVIFVNFHDSELTFQVTFHCQLKLEQTPHFLNYSVQKKKASVNVTYTFRK